VNSLFTNSEIVNIEKIQVTSNFKHYSFQIKYFRIKVNRINHFTFSNKILHSAFRSITFTEKLKVIAKKRKKYQIELSLAAQTNALQARYNFSKTEGATQKLRGRNIRNDLTFKVLG